MRNVDIQVKDTTEKLIQSLLLLRFIIPTNSCAIINGKTKKPILKQYLSCHFLKSSVEVNLKLG